MRGQPSVNFTEDKQCTYIQYISLIVYAYILNASALLFSDWMSTFAKCSIPAKAVSDLSFFLVKKNLPTLSLPPKDFPSLC